jgi:hypothetical protein
MKIPRDPEDDYTPDAAEARRAFLHAQIGAGLDTSPLLLRGKRAVAEVTIPAALIEEHLHNQR